MPANRIRVVARFAVQKDRIDEFKRLAKQTLVTPTVGEPGCLEYELCQDEADPTRFAMIETWESAEALAAHLAQPSLQGAVGKLAPMASEPPTVQRVRPI
jgi:quinol monooxygenase YgiN